MSLVNFKKDWVVLQKIKEKMLGLFKLPIFPYVNLFLDCLIMLIVYFSCFVKVFFQRNKKMGMSGANSYA